MYIEVCFKRKDGKYGGNAYTYNCAFPVKTGDLVLAPTFKGDTPAMVVGIGIAYDEINPKYRDNIRSVKEYAPFPMEPWEEEGFPPKQEVIV